MLTLTILADVQLDQSSEVSNTGRNAIQVILTYRELAESRETKESLTEEGGGGGEVLKIINLLEIHILGYISAHNRRLPSVIGRRLVFGLAKLFSVSTSQQLEACTLSLGFQFRKACSQSQAS